MTDKDEVVWKLYDPTLGDLEYEGYSTTSVEITETQCTGSFRSGGLSTNV